MGYLVFGCDMRNRRGFTIIELLVTIGIVALVASLLTVGMSRAKKSGAMTKDLSLVRQNAAATLMYVSDFKDAFPLLGKHSYDVMHWWYECLLASGHVASRQAVDPHYKEPPVHRYQRFEFTRTTAISQQYLTERGATEFPVNHLSGQRLAAVAYPSQKGMIVRGWNGEYPFAHSSEEQRGMQIEWFIGSARTPLAAMDGAGRIDARAKMIGGTPEVVINSIGVPFYSTWGGLRGIDWH
jgi:prepilin-type N-terminal cleavage/methylation domain-containing protein